MKRAMRAGGAVAPWRRPAATRAALLGCAAAMAVCLVLNLGPALAQGNTAVIVGAERVFVRRGPGTEFPPFATLTLGDAVEVQEMRGEWARILTAGGQSGYVRGTFLSPLGDRVRPPGPPPIATAAQAAPTAAVPPAAEAAPAQVPIERNKTLEAEVRTLQQQVGDAKARLENTAATPSTEHPSATETAASSAAAAELARLAAEVEAIQRRLDSATTAAASSAGKAAAPATGTDSTELSWSSGTLAVGFLGLVLGWVIGNAVGRKQERNRRFRIRF